MCKVFSTQPAAQWPWKVMDSEFSTLHDPLFTMSYLSYTSHPSGVWTMPEEHFIKHAAEEKRTEDTFNCLCSQLSLNGRIFFIYCKYLVTSSTK